MDPKMEQAQLLARFKLHVKRSLNESVDLMRMARDPEYARQRLAEIEEQATEESLLVMVIRLRDALLPADSMPSPTAPAAAPASAGTAETRNYLMGARAW